MSMENTIVDSNTDLDTFSAEFFGQTPATTEEATSEVIKAEIESDAPTIEDTHSDSESENSEPNDELEESAEPTVEKPKKNRFQERIDELTAKAREAERKAEEFERKLQELQVAAPKPENKTPTIETNNNGPQPDDLTEDGSDKYPLGEFDPNYLKDFVAFQFEQRETAAAQKQEQLARQRAEEAEQATLRQGWEDKLTPAQERYPDFLEKGQRLVDSLNGIDPTYSEFLSATIMSLDNGPDVLYHLANNPADVQAIVNAGGLKAAVMLGGLDARFKLSQDEQQSKQPGRPKVSNAPPPPAQLNKGSSAALPEVPDDTDDLEAFSAKLFRKR